MVINNTPAGQRFVLAARALLKDKYLPQLDDSKYWFGLVDMMNIAEEFHIFGAFNNSGNHWRLVLEVQSLDQALVYDPLFTDAQGKHVYPLKLAPDSVTFPSRDLIRAYNLSPTETCFSLDQEGERKRLEGLINHNYRLYLPTNFIHEKIQHDSWNCGPLTLYAALIADEHTREFQGKVNLPKLRALTDIVVYTSGKLV